MSTRLRINAGSITMDVEGGEHFVMEIYKDFKNTLLPKLDFESKTLSKKEIKETPETKPPAKVEKNVSAQETEEEKVPEPPAVKEEEPEEASSEETASSGKLTFRDFIKKYNYETVYEQLLIAAFYFYLNGNKKFTRVDYIDLLKKNGLHTNSTRNSCGYSLGMLQKKKLITKIDRGVYKILPNGIEAVKEMRK